MAEHVATVWRNAGEEVRWEETTNKTPQKWSKHKVLYLKRLWRVPKGFPSKLKGHKSCEGAFLKEKDLSFKYHDVSLPVYTDNILKKDGMWKAILEAIGADGKWLKLLKWMLPMFILFPSTDPVSISRPYMISLFLASAWSRTVLMDGAKAVAVAHSVLTVACSTNRGQLYLLM